jgi:hypothetical protein
MSIDIMDMVKGAVSKQIMGKLGGLLGTDESKTSSAFEKAAGAILGGLMKKAGTEDGARVVYESAQKQDAGILDKLDDILGGGQATEELEKSGGGILETIMGGGQSGILEALSKAIGLDGNMVGKLLKMVAPIVLAVIGRHIKSKALDMVGMGDLFNGQKQHLSKYVPASLASSLGVSNMLESSGDAVSNLKGMVDDQVGNAGDVAAKSGGLLKFLLPIAALCLIMWGVWSYVVVPWMNPRLTLTQYEPDPTRDRPQAVSVGSSAAGGGNSRSERNPTKQLPKSKEVDLSWLRGKGEALEQGFGDIFSGFEDLKDEQSAKDIADSITSFSDEIDGLDLESQSGIGKGTLRVYLTQMLEKMSKLMAGVKDEALKNIINGPLEGLKEKLAAFL